MYSHFMHYFVLLRSESINLFWACVINGYTTYNDFFIKWFISVYFEKDIKYFFFPKNILIRLCFLAVDLSNGVCRKSFDQVLSKILFPSFFSKAYNWIVCNGGGVNLKVKKVARLYLSGFFYLWHLSIHDRKL